MQGPPPVSVDKDLPEKIAALNVVIEGLKRASSAPTTASTAVPGSRATFGASSASRTPFVVPMDDDL